jgi:hypothetical protein
MHQRRQNQRINKEEAAHLFDQLQSEERSETAWNNMLEESHDSAEAFEDVEEHLVELPHEHNHNLRGWKFFGK